MTIDVDSARHLAARVLDLTEADEAEVLVSSQDSALTRFANNHIHQNVAEENTRVSVRAVLGKRVGVAATNRLDDESLAACCNAAVTAASHAPEDPGFPGLPDPASIEVVDREGPAVAEFRAVERAEAARSIIEQSRFRELTAAGTVSASTALVCVANSRGVDAAMRATGVTATVLSMGSAGGSGWASYVGRDQTGLSPAALGDQAADLASRSENPGSLDPGGYIVVLGPEAVADLIDFLSYVGFSAKAFAEGSSFMAGHEGEKLMSEKITIVDDALAPDALGLTFDFEGVPKRRTPLIEKGVAVAPVTDSYWAAQLDRQNTGHALPAPNSFGPVPLDLRMEPGDASVDDLIAAVGRGVYVTRFNYVNVEDPVKVLLTGMTRDGTFMIEDGKLTRPLKNLRFTQSAITALKNVRAVGRDRRFCGTEGPTSLVPAILTDGFEFTGQTG